MALLFWIVILVISAWAELHTNALVGGFVALGAIVAIVLDTAHVSFPVQALVWLIVSVVSTLSLRPFALRTMGKRRPGDLIAPASAALSGQLGVIEEETGDDLHPGRVRLRGETWRAVSDGPTIEKGAAVIVTKVLGTTLFVRPRD